MVSTMEQIVPTADAMLSLACAGKSAAEVCTDIAVT